MLFLGITGGLATGKSLVTRRLQALGAVTFSADEAARAILAPNGAAMRAIADQFGSSVLTSDSSLDRAALGARIFTDPDARQRLNAITHPLILRLLNAQMQAVRDDLPARTVVAVEVPLLFETHLEAWFDRVVVVTASEAIQVARLCERNGLDKDEARQRLAAQWPMAEKVARADDIIVNDDGIEAVYTAIDSLWEMWQVLAARP